MIENNIALIANYFWKESINNISNTLSEAQISNFNMNDYYYLTSIYQLGTPKLGDLATKLNLTKPAISALVKRLEKNELIIKTQSKEDKRVYFVSLTDKAIKIIEGDNKLYENLSNVFSDFLTNEEMEIVDNLLQKVVDKFIQL
ncbi:MarR family transcriptional regulator [Clostridium saccharoperbutylacetonicum]|uniref:MarR family transcriptional regulator n=1 Tax=Clostridium saccharoperbutylacetonicum TaxID=36745 RepID=UPI000983F7DC|nr:MarR family transcriptional regulator [Clostridium saccharoperbutylacetonicum]AQR94704.1 putative HTH-type transcriptional regulator YusO [Clostridium saccharoperbutylacetonicum]NSB30545.1 DNA-binding MarR family transcriptional regulator [Clostridium saccharoperbutylacetonicum]